MFGPISGMRTALMFLSVSGALHGEVLDILVIEVEQRLVEPTLARALAANRDALDEAITKLRALAPHKGVMEHASISLDLGSDGQKVGKSGIQYGPDIPGRGADYRRFGWSLAWNPQGNMRKLEILPHATLAAAPRFAASLTHPPDGRWSLSTATSTPKGALFIFEKVEGREPSPDRPVWVATSLLSGDQTPGGSESQPERWLSTKGPIRSSILRKPSSSEDVCSIESDLRPFCGAWRNYSKSQITFSTFMGTGQHAGMVVCKVDFKYLEDLQSASHSAYSGTFQQPFGTGKLPISSTDSFDISSELVTRDGNTTTSRPLKEKNSLQRRLQAMIFASR